MEERRRPLVEGLEDFETERGEVGRKKKLVGGAKVEGVEKEEGAVASSDEEEVRR